MGWRSTLKPKNEHSTTIKLLVWERGLIADMLPPRLHGTSGICRGSNRDLRVRW